MKTKTPPCALLTLAVITIAFLTACTETPAEEAVSPQVAAVPAALADTLREAPAWPALALLETGHNPLWFELSPGGPLLVDSPAAASLVPYAPWPHARHVAGMTLWQDFLVMAVNLDGFLVLSLADAGENANDTAARTRALLYRASGGEFWERYTAGSLFIWQDQPAVLLYRSGFFAPLYPVPPQPQVFVLDKASAAPVGTEIPAFNVFHIFPASENWEAEIVRHSPSGYWYFRMREKGGQRNQSAYFRTQNLETEGQRISTDQWRNSEIHREAEDRTDALANALQEFSLPPLPEGFVYTGAARLGDIVLASWEEQQGVSIGAAGFMVKKGNGE